MTLGFLSADGSPAAVRLDGSAAAAEHMVLLDQRERALKVEATGPVVMAPLRGYSAPVDLAVDATDDALATVLLGDPDAVARWWAAETLMTRVVDAHRSGADAVRQASNSSPSTTNGPCSRSGSVCWASAQ